MRQRPRWKEKKCFLATGKGILVAAVQRPSAPQALSKNCLCADQPCRAFIPSVPEVKPSRPGTQQTTRGHKAPPKLSARSAVSKCPPMAAITIPNQRGRCPPTRQSAQSSTNRRALGATPSLGTATRHTHCSTKGGRLSPAIAACEKTHDVPAA